MRLFLLSIISIFSYFSISFGADTTTVKAASEEISENFDLTSVASIFGEAKNLEEFEKTLNDPELQLSNLDLSGDGEVDYLRVMETVKGNTHYIAIQAIIGEDKYQDVCTIEVEKTEKGKEVVQVVGDTYIYGPSYIYQPVYVSPPLIYVVFWAPMYNPWYSPWYYHHRPPYYHPWRPYPTPVYRTNVSVHVNRNVSYNRTTVRYSKTSVNINKTKRSNDFGKQNPNRSYNSRNKVGTKPENKMGTKPISTDKTNPNGKVNSDWKPNSQRDKSSVGAVKQPRSNNSSSVKNNGSVSKPISSTPQIKQPKTVSPPKQNKSNTKLSPSNSPRAGGASGNRGGGKKRR